MNKPQCLTAAQCLKELARVMEQFGIDNPMTATKSKYVRYAQEHWSSMPIFNTPSDWSFAIAEVEGKPVFIGDILWCVSGALYANGYSFKASAGMDFDKTVWSFNPPKPKTIMVELLVEDAEALARHAYSKDSVAKSCAKALEELKS